MNDSIFSSCSLSSSVSEFSFSPTSTMRFSLSCSSRPFKCSRNASNDGVGALGSGGSSTTSSEGGEFGVTKLDGGTGSTSEGFELNGDFVLEGDFVELSSVGKPYSSLGLGKTT